MLNISAIVGRLVADPELKQTPTGNSVTTFTVACDRNMSKNKETDWIDCVAWRGTAEFICKFFRKGAMIALNGTLQTRTYEDKNGNKRKITELVVQNANFCGSKTESPAEQNIRAAAGVDISVDDDENFTEIPTADDLPF